VDETAFRARAKVDAAREQAIADAYREVGVADDIAEMLGQIGVAVLIGLQHRGGTTDRVVVRRLYTLLQEMAAVSFVRPSPDPPLRSRGHTARPTDAR
jgi:hypothetical protein